MVKSFLFCFVLVSTGVIGAVLGFGTNDASAADDCITESNLIPPKGSRWYHHIDRATNRKCWYIAPIAAAPAGAPPQRASARSEPGQTGRGKHQLSESEKAALFHEFLRWKEQQSAMNSRAGGP